MEKRIHLPEPYKAHDIRLLKWIILILWMLLPALLFAQQDWEKDGGIPNAEIEIIKDRQITLPPADRSFEKIPPRPAEPIRPEIIYQLKNLYFPSPDFNPAIRPLKLKQEDITKIFGNFLSAGVGNYSSPYLEGSINSKRNKNKFYGLRFFHHSFGRGPVDDENSASGSTEIGLFGKVMSNSVALSGSFNFENRTGFFYGYAPGTEPPKDQIRQSYNIVTLAAGLENAKTTDFEYSLRGSYSNLSDHYQAKESELGLLFKSSYKVADDTYFLLNADYFLIDRTDSLPTLKARHLFKVKPAYQFVPMENLLVTIGGNGVYENDTLGKNKSLHMYPDFRMNYQVSKQLAAYAQLVGDMDKVSLQSLSRDNMWVNSNIGIFHTNRSIELVTGIKSMLGKKIAMGAGFSVANLKNLYFFENSVGDRSKFDITYDVGDVKRINPFLEFAYLHGETMKMTVRGDYFKYATDMIAEPYHRPTYRLVYNSTFNVYSKLLFNVDLIAQGGAKAFDVELGQTVKLGPATDLNFRADYFVSRQVSCFLKFNNILSNKYEVYLHYPVRGFQAMGGLTWCF